MAEQQPDVLSLLPGASGVRSSDLYIPTSALRDADALIDAADRWLDFQIGTAEISSQQISVEAHALCAAATYQRRIGEEFHAYYFQELRRLKRFEETARLIQRGLAQLKVAGFHDNFAKAADLFRFGPGLWEARAGNGWPTTYAATRVIMRDVDARYVALANHHDLKQLLAEALLRLPCVQFVCEHELDAVRSALLHDRLMAGVC